MQSVEKDGKKKKKNRMKEIISEESVLGGKGC